MSLLHHRDVATAINLALNGVMDGYTVNIMDEAPTSIYELSKIIGVPIDTSSEPLVNPWFGIMDGSLARTLGFKPIVRTVHQAAQEGAL